jgi:RNA polymerase-binding transcription factor DksA
VSRGPSGPAPKAPRAEEDVSIDPEEARQRVRAEYVRVEDLVRNLKAELDGETEGERSELADYDQHPADTASDTFEREKDLSILEQLEAELAEFQAALERIDAGTYGIDEVTGEPIAPERLAANPIARTNVGTRTDSERRR